MSGRNCIIDDNWNDVCFSHSLHESWTGESWFGIDEKLASASADALFAECDNRDEQIAWPLLRYRSDNKQHLPTSMSVLPFGSGATSLHLATHPPVRASAIRAENMWSDRGHSSSNWNQGWSSSDLGWYGQGQGWQGQGQKGRGRGGKDRGQAWITMPTLRLSLLAALRKRITSQVSAW